MTSAIRVSGPIETRDLEGTDGRFELLTPIVIDLGMFLPELHLWATNSLGDGVQRSIQLSERGTTLISVPVGFDTDFSSINVPAQLVMGPKHRYRLAGVAHDWLFRHHAPRAAADRVWWVIARSGHPHVGPVRGFLGWAALRLFGWLAYGRQQQACSASTSRSRSSRCAPKTASSTVSKASSIRKRSAASSSAVRGRGPREVMLPNDDRALIHRGDE